MRIYDITEIPEHLRCHFVPAPEIGQEATPAEFVSKLVEVFAEVRRVLKPDGTLWLNLGDSYAGSGKGAGDTKTTNKGNGSSRGVRMGSVHGESGHTSGVRPPPGLKAKDLVGIPWRVAFALQADGWYLRSDIIWAKSNCMPESVTDRPTRSHEYVFLLSKAPRYFYDHEAIKEPCVYDLDGTGTAARKARASKSLKSHPTAERAGIREAKPDKQRGHSRKHSGFNDRWDNMERKEQCTGMRNKRDVWTVAPANYPEAHFATYPPALIKPCVLAGSRPGDMVLDPFGGSGTTGKVALGLGRDCTLIELNAEYLPLIAQRTNTTAEDLALHA